MTEKVPCSEDSSSYNRDLDRQIDRKKVRGLDRHTHIIYSSIGNGPVVNVHSEIAAKVGGSGTEVDITRHRHLFIGISTMICGVELIKKIYI